MWDSMLSCPSVSTHSQGIGCCPAVSSFFGCLPCSSHVEIGFKTTVHAVFIHPLSFPRSPIHPQSAQTRTTMPRRMRA